MRAILFLAVIVLTGCARCNAPTSQETDLGPTPPKGAHRIVSLAPSLTDMIVAMHATDRLVGVTRFDDTPEVASVTRIGGYTDPDMEAVLRVNPDLLVCTPSPGNQATVEALSRAGIPVVALQENTLDDAEEGARRLGELLNLPDAAREQIDRLRKAREDARQAARKRGRKPRVAVLVDANPLVAAGPGSFLDEMLMDAGAEDVVERSIAPFPHLSPETFFRTKPDALLLTIHGREVPPGGPVPGLNAQIIPLLSEGFMHPGPKVVEALHELSADLDRIAAAQR